MEISMLSSPPPPLPLTRFVDIAIGRAVVVVIKIFCEKEKYSV
jgi:hypothetical protein